MASIALVPALSLIAGAALGLVWNGAPLLAPAVAAIVAAAWIASAACFHRWLLVLLICGFFLSGAVLAADARADALYTPLRILLDREFGGFSIDASGSPSRHDPLAISAVLLEDAAPQPEFTTLRARVEAVRVRGQWHATNGAVIVTVGGNTPRTTVEEWTRGRTIETFAAFRRPTRYLNHGVPDFERQLALDGTTLFASVKSGLLVQVTRRGGPTGEAAARVRHHVRRAVRQSVAPHDPVSAAIVTAVLIGDRSGLPDEIRLRLQAAGTYHVIAISGGNIGILAAVALGLLLVSGITGRPAAAVTIAVLVGYAGIVAAGPSVWRATLMAALYLVARLLDHRTPPWHAMALAAAVIVCARPLDVRDAGFILTFGATAALLEGARRVARRHSRGRVVTWLLASIAASAAAEAALLPVSAATFSRVTTAGLVLNLAAVPLMGVVQVAGMVVAALGVVGIVAAPAGWIAHAAAAALIDSARLVDVAPWLTARVPSPPIVLTVSYYMGLAAALAGPRLVRAGGVALVALSAAGIVSGQPAGWLRATADTPTLRVTMFDVGQGDATLLQFPDQSTLLVDTGGIPFGSGGFDVGSRVLSPALWARGLRGLDRLLLTHGDPDHIGGARGIVNDFGPGVVWEGVPVPRHAALQSVLQQARDTGAVVERRLAGDEHRAGPVRLRVLHPPPPDWERRRVRNDDSVVLEVLFGEVAVLLPGDIGASIERSILSQLTPAAIRVLKLAHHGSRTSTSRDLVENWQPQIAIVSAGRGNTFGHPAPEVVQRLEAVGAAIYRTDLDGQITIETDGHQVRIETFVGELR